MSLNRVLEPPRDLSAQNRLQESILENRQRVSIVERFVPPPRIALPFNTSWQNYATGYAPCTFYADRGRVYLEGLARWNTTSAYTSGSVIATLPSGFCPTTGYHVMLVNTSTGPQRLDIATTGTLAIIGSLPSGGGQFVSFNSISFRL